MTKELFIEIINKRLFFELGLIILVYFTGWVITLKLGFLILGVKIRPQRLLIPVLIMLLFSFFAKQLLPAPIVGLVMAIFVAVILAIIGKTNILKSFWTAFLIILLNLAGDIVIAGPMCSLNKNMALFIFTTPYGNIMISLIEIIFPTLALLLLPKFNISLIPTIKKKITSFDVICVLTYSAMYFLFFSLLMKLVITFRGNPRQVFTDLSFEWITTLVIILGHYMILGHTKKQREHERKIYEGQILKLIEENQELSDINKQLKAQNLEPREVVEVIDGIINKLQNVSNSIIIQNKAENTLEKCEVKDITPREMSIIELIAQGKSNKEIAASIYLSEGRIKNIITKLLEKLGLADRTQLAVYAVKNNLVNKE